MITLQGKGVSSGVAFGHLCFYRRGTDAFERRTVEDTASEWKRFKEAQEKAIEELNALAQRTREEIGEEAALLFETHAMMAEDMDFEDSVESAIKEDKKNAEAAVSDTGETFSEMFAAMENTYMRARAADVKDVSTRILNILLGIANTGINADEPVILASDNLKPSETVQLDRTRILGIVTTAGAPSGHTAILARTMGIPAIVGIGNALREDMEGETIILDGETGTVIVSPDAKTLDTYVNKLEENKRRSALLNELKGCDNITKDNQTVRIYCNIGSPEDVTQVLENDGGGVGLFRSEFLYLNCDSFPSEEEQFQAYQKALTQMEGREVVIRTLDIGADKKIAYFDLPKEENPAMGNRALRICLTRPEIFRTQLRALYRASAFGKLSIMFPMVTSVWEVREVKRICAEVREELQSDGIAFDKNVPLGIMIETPAAAIMSDLLAKEVDFFSCGTNDLTQYTLACDRQNNDLGRFFDPHHPAVLRLLKIVCDNAHKNGIWVGICGEIAADLALTETFLSIGIDELSVSPRAVLPLRQKIRETDVGKIRDKILSALVSEE